eukprot:1439779-Heterocapsa_arctica.AAC.1
MNDRGYVVMVLGESCRARQDGRMQATLLWCLASRHVDTTASRLTRNVCRLEASAAGWRCHRIELAGVSYALPAG